MMESLSGAVLIVSLKNRIGNGNLYNLFVTAGLNRQGQRIKIFL
ncbi:hypothetical protein HMPREF7215_1046 [Pyramidobacter piscolens W5455]|uniref:Uncharacterized protein n=1 Tax=Pyramidobacter piscolens W5455 TaxID=352165 RepID=A0ABM9ZUW5_9BACT|nr:hypothetical protein HMPREF7215_1046 [Pyramidobacter piscolens W5455]